MLPLHVGGDLDPRHVDGVDRHLSACLPCFREFRELAAMRGRLAVLADEPLPEGALDGFTEQVMARIAVREPGPKAEAPRPGPRVFVLPRLAAAAAVMLVALAGWRLFSDGGFRMGSEQSAFTGGDAVSTAPATNPGAPNLDQVSVHQPAAATRGVPADPRAVLPPGLVMPTETEQQIRAGGGEPGKIYLLQIGAGTGLQLESEPRTPRSRDH